MPKVSESVTPRAKCAPVESYGAIDHWQPVRLMAEGHWTRVFQARPEGSPDDWPSDYVLKVLKSEYEDDAMAARQIQQEAVVGSQVTHPNLVSVLSSRVEGSPLYVVMPHLEGVTLASLLMSTTQLCIPQALWIARQTAEALRALHLAGWMHADVKPSNLLVNRQGHATVVDLGFARSFEKPNEQRIELVGTMNYAAPEVFIDNCGRDGQCDVYSLGVTLFEMLTGRLPFVEEDATQLALAHLREELPEPRTFNPNLPPRLVRLLKKMMAKEPVRRPRVDELVSILYELEIDTFDMRSVG